jgi:hypothetical protein
MRACPGGSAPRRDHGARARACVAHTPRILSPPARGARIFSQAHIDHIVTPTLATTMQRIGQRRARSSEISEINKFRPERADELPGSQIVVISGLERSITSGALQETFTSFGKVLDCRIIHILPGTNQGTALILFELKEAAQNAVSHVDGKNMHEQKVQLDMLEPGQAATLIEQLTSAAITEAIDAEAAEAMRDQLDDIAALEEKMDEETEAIRQVAAATVAEAEARAEAAERAAAHSDARTLAIRQVASATVAEAEARAEAAERAAAQNDARSLVMLKEYRDDAVHMRHIAGQSAVLAAEVHRLQAELDRMQVQLQRVQRVAALQERKSFARTRLNDAYVAFEKARHEYEEAQSEASMVDRELQEVQGGAAGGVTSSSASLTSDNLIHLPLSPQAAAQSRLGDSQSLSGGSESTHMSEVVKRTAMQSANDEDAARAKHAKETAELFKNFMRRVNQIHPPHPEFVHAKFGEQLGALRPLLPQNVYLALDTMRAWRNAEQHGVDGVPWHLKPQGGGSQPHRRPPLPPKQHVKQLSVAIDDYLKSKQA